MDDWLSTLSASCPPLTTPSCVSAVCLLFVLTSHFAIWLQPRIVSTKRHLMFNKYFIIVCYIPWRGDGGVMVIGRRTRDQELRVRVPTIPLSCNDPRQVVYTRASSPAAYFGLTKRQWCSAAGQVIRTRRNVTFTWRSHVGLTASSSSGPNAGNKYGITFFIAQSSFYRYVNQSSK